VHSSINVSVPQPLTIWLITYHFLAAIQNIEQDLHATTNEIALSLSLFILVQGNFPLIWSSISEIKGRKFVYIFSMIVSFMCALIIAQVAEQTTGIHHWFSCRRSFKEYNRPNMHAHVPGSRIKRSPSDWCWNTCRAHMLILHSSIPTSHMFLPFIIQDIYSPKERGTMMGIYYAAPLLGPSLGPLFGGVLAEVWSWRATFYFLTIIGGIVLISLFLFNDTYRRERSLTYQSAARHALHRAEEKARKRNKDVEKGPLIIDPATVSVTLADLNLFTPIWNVLKRKNNLFILLPSGL
jgi:MFS family permease